MNETLERVFRHIEESAKGSQSESSFAGLFDDYDVNSNKLGATVAKRNEKLVKLLDGVAAMNLGDVRDHDIDAFGDAYEYLMTMYASNAGKSGGEFFTPADVSELLTRLGTVGKTEINKVYDPACGSGSLLLKAEKVLGRDAIRNGFFGQEINITTYNLCRINMFLHDVGFDKFDIACENTLISPQHWDDEPFELIVSNPPYSIKWAGDDDPILINDPRFSPAGVLAPKSKADLAFIMHSLSWLAPNGTAAIVCFPGIMYRGGAEQKIRKYLIDNNFVDCIIQLPANLFFGTSIATCIMVLKRGKANNKILFIDASGECVKVTNNNTDICVDFNGTKTDIRTKEFVKLADKLYAFAIPVPHGRQEADQISIEHYFTDTEIKTEYNGKRLFMGNEFYRTGVFIGDEELYYKGATTVAGTIKIIEHESKKYVTKVDGTGDHSISKALFVQCIEEELNEFAHFSFAEFLKIFDTLGKIADDYEVEAQKDCK